MRLDCPVETYADNYVEISEQWSRAELRKFQGRGNEAIIETLQNKVTELHIRLLDGTVVTDPKKIDMDFVDGLQWEVFQWFIYAPNVVMNGILDLGEAYRRRLLGITEEKKDSPEPQVTQSTPTSSPVSPDVP